VSEAGPIKAGPIEAGIAHADALAAIHAAAFRADEAWPAAGLTADEAEILTLAVVPEARHGGIGLALVEAAMRRAAVAGAAAMFLEVASTNTPARALYAKAGFVRVGRRARYYADGGDALVLRAELGAVT
jgi:ribosomal-protein-alanine N-acetyltransferase